MVDSMAALKKIPQARFLYEKLKPIRKSLKETLLYKIGLSEDEVPF